MIKKTKLSLALILISAFIIGTIPGITPVIPINTVGDLPTDLTEDNMNNLYSAQSASVLSWWNESYQYRNRVEINNTLTFTRDVPIDLELSFDDEHCIEDSVRVTHYEEITDTWTLIPSEVSNVTNYGVTDFVESCQITFVIEDFQPGVSVFYVYYDAEVDYDPTDYSGYEFQTTLAGDDLEVVWDVDELDYNLSMAVDKGMYELNGNYGNNFNAENSTSPGLANINKDLTAYWSFDSETPEEAIYDNEYNIYGQDTYVDGVYGKARYFDGSADYVAVNQSSDVFGGTNTNGFSMMAWVKVEDNNRERIIASWDRSEFWRLSIDSSERVYFATTTTTTDDMYSTQSLTNGVWSHIAVTYDPVSGDKKIFINGTLDSTQTHTNKGVFGQSNPIRYGYLGSGSEDGTYDAGTPSPTYYYYGSVDELRIYNRTLTEFDINKAKDLSASTSSIASITEDSDATGDVIATYEVIWNDVEYSETDKMSTSDKWTFYNNLNMWKVERTFKWNFHFQDPDNELSAFNTLYQWDVDDSQLITQDFYYYDDQSYEGHSDVDFTVENYTIVHDFDGTNHKTALGLFVSDITPDSDYVNATELDWRIDTNPADQSINFVAGNETDFDNAGGLQADYTVTVEFWQYLRNDVNQFDVDYDAYLNYFDNIYQSLITPLDITYEGEESRFFNYELTVVDHDGLEVPNVNATIYNITKTSNPHTYEEVESQLTDENGMTTFNNLVQNNYTVNLTYTPYETHAPLWLGQFNFTLNQSLTTYQNVREQEIEVGLTSLVLNFKTDPTGGEESTILTGAKIDFYEDTGSENKTIGTEVTDIDGNVTLRWTNFTSGSDKIVFNCTVLGSSKLINITDGVYVNSITSEFSERSYLDVTVQVDPFTSNLTVADVTSDHTYLNDVIIDLNFNYTINPDNPTSPNYEVGTIPGATVDYQIKYQSAVVWNGNFGTTDADGNLTGVIDYIEDEIPLETEKDYALIITAEKEGYQTITEILNFRLNDITTSLKSDDISETAYWGNNLEIDVFYNDTFWDAGIESALVTYAILEDSSIFGTISPNLSKATGYYSINLDTTLFSGTGDYNLIIAADKANYESQGISIPLSISDITTSLTIDEDDIQVYWLENFTMRVQFLDTLTPANINDATVTWTLPSNPTINGVLKSEGSNGYYSAEVNSTTFLYAQEFTVRIDAQLDNYENLLDYITVDVDEIYTLINSTNGFLDTYDVFAMESLSLNFNYSYRIGGASSSTYEPVADATIAEWSVVDYDSGEEIDSGNLVWDASSGLYVLDTVSEIKELGTYKFTIRFLEFNFISQTGIVLINIVNRTTDLTEGETDVTIYRTEELVFNYTYWDLVPETPSRITDASTISYSWTKYADSSRQSSLDSGAGTLTLDANQNYTLDMDTEDLGIGYYVIAVNFDKTNFTTQTTELRLTVISKSVTISWVGGLDEETPLLDVLKGESLTLTINLDDPQANGAPLTGATVVLKITNLNDEKVFTETSPGVYVLELSTEEYQAFVQDFVLSAKIEISKTDYETTSKDVQITVGMQEIFDGVPLFYFIIGVGLLVVLVGGIGGYRYVQFARIPEFVKKCDATIKAINKGKSVDASSPITAPKREVVTGLFASDWEYFGLNFETSLNSGKKGSTDSYTDVNEQGGL